MPVNLIIRNPLDRDAREYFSRANISSSTARTQINGFVRGVKALGFWPKLLCWPMRSAQNYGGADATDTRVASLGGLGTFNGTRAGGPTWGANGLTYDGVDDWVTTSFTLGSTEIFCGMVGPMANKGNWYAGTNGQPSDQHLVWLNPRSGFGGEFRYSGSNLAASDNTTTGVHMWSTIGGVGLNTKGYRGTTLVGTASTAAATPSLLTLSSGLALGRSAGGYEGTAAFSFIVHAAPSSPDAFYNLYKTTLGTDLGLP